MRIQDITSTLGKASSSTGLTVLPLSPAPSSRTTGLKEGVLAWHSLSRAQPTRTRLQPEALGHLLADFQTVKPTSLQKLLGPGLALFFTFFT